MNKQVARLSTPELLELLKVISEELEVRLMQDA